MKYQFFTFFIFIFFTPYIVTNNHHNDFIILQKPLLKFYDGTPIHISQNRYEHVINKWQQKLSKTWHNISSNLNKYVNISSEQIDDILTNQAFTHLYMLNKKNEISEMQELQTTDAADQEVINFIKRTLAKFCNKKNIKIFLTPYIPSLTLTCGSDNDTHYVFFNSMLYSIENIRHYYEALTNNKGLFHINMLDSNDIQFIEISNLLLVGIVKAASNIEHQSNITSYLISFLLYNNKIDETENINIVKRCMQYCEFRSILESIFQSKNPLETAFYCLKNHVSSTHEYKILQELVEDLSTCYHPKSFLKFNQITTELKSLYHDFC